MGIDRRKVYDKFNGHCAYCGQELEFDKMQIDHLYPKRLSNSHDFNNLMPSCRICNHYKRADLLESFRNKMLTLHERLQSIYIIKVAMRFGLLKIEKFNGKFYFEEFFK